MHRIATIIEVYVCGVCVCVCVCVCLVSYITITMDVSLLIYLCLIYNLYICTAHMHAHCHHSAWSIILKHLCMCSCVYVSVLCAYDCVIMML